jgi:hypothetical protein
MLEKIQLLRRAVQYGLKNGKKNMIVDLDVLREILYWVPSNEGYYREKIKQMVGCRRPVPDQKVDE